MGVGLLLTTLQLTLALVVNLLAVIAFVCVFFDKEPKWLDDMHKDDGTSCLWYLTPYWLWPTQMVSATQSIGGSAYPGAGNKPRPTLELSRLHIDVRASQNSQAEKQMWVIIGFRFLPFFLGLLGATIFGWSLVMKKRPLGSAKTRFLFLFAFQTWSMIQFCVTLFGWLSSWILGASVFEYFYPASPISKFKGKALYEAAFAGQDFVNTMLFIGFAFAGLSGMMSYLTMIGSSTKVTTTEDQDEEYESAYEKQQMLPGGSFQQPSMYQSTGQKPLYY